MLEMSAVKKRLGSNLFLQKHTPQKYLVLKSLRSIQSRDILL